MLYYVLGEKENDDDVQEVQENEIVQKRKKTTKAEKKNWTSDEEVALAKAWVHISTCPYIGAE